MPRQRGSSTLLRFSVSRTARTDIYFHSQFCQRCFDIRISIFRDYENSKPIQMDETYRSVTRQISGELLWVQELYLRGLDYNIFTDEDMSRYNQIFELSKSDLMLRNITYICKINVSRKEDIHFSCIVVITIYDKVVHQVVCQQTDSIIN